MAIEQAEDKAKKMVMLYLDTLFGRNVKSRIKDLEEALKKFKDAVEESELTIDLCDLADLDREEVQHKLFYLTVTLAHVATLLDTDILEMWDKARRMCLKSID